MKIRKVTLVDLHYDILKEILICVAKSSDGAKHFANAMSVCKALQQYVEDVDVLRVVNFDNIPVSGRWELFQLRGGLTFRCARSGQTQAQFILAKIILVSTSQLLMAKTEHKSSSKGGNLSEKADKTGPENFLEIFQKKLTTSNFLGKFLARKTGLNFIGHHFDYVKFFLLRAGCCEFIEMKPHIKNYMSYFMVCMERDHKHCKTMKHLVDRQLCGLENYCINKRVISRLLELSGTSTIMKLCLKALTLAEDCRLLGLKEELLGTITALDAEESEEVGCDDYFSMVEAKLDIKLNRFRAVKSVLESLREASQNWPPLLPLPKELTRDALLNTSMCCIERVTEWLTHLELAKHWAFRMLANRVIIISTFHHLFKEPCSSM